MVVPFTDTEGAKRNRENLERLRQQETKPVKDPDLIRVRRGIAFPEHYPKVADKVEAIKTSVASGTGIRQTARETGVAVNTVRKIVRTDEDKTMPNKYDHLIPKILEDLKTMNLSQCEIENGIAKQCLSGMLKGWKKKGLIPADYVAPGQGISSAKGRKPPKAKTHNEPKPPKTETIPPVCETPVLPTWNEIKNESESVKCKWLEVTGQLLKAAIEVKK